MKTSRIILALLPLAMALPFTGTAMAQGTAEQRAACGPDAFRLCAATIPNVGKTAACLRCHREQLSAACQTVMDAAGGGGAKVAEAPPRPKAAPPVPRAAARTRPVARVAARPEPAPQRAAPMRQRVVERYGTAPRNAGRAGATRVITRTVYVYVPAKRAAAPRAGIRQASARPYYGRRGRGGSQMAQAMYWMKTVSGYANAMGYGSALGSLGGMAGLGGLDGL